MWNWWRWRRARAHPLLIAIREGDLATVERLVAAGADPNAGYPSATGHDLSPLCQATISNQMHIAEWLLHHGTRLDTVEDVGFLLLNSAIAARAVGLVRHLLALGLEPTIGGGSSSMVEAAWSDSLEIFELLLEHGASVRDMESIDDGMIFKVRGDILRAAILAGARLPEHIEQMALAHQGRGDPGVMPDRYRR